MHPVAFEIGPLAIRWYGILVAAGFFIGFCFVSWRAPRRGGRREDVADLILWGMLGGLIGARMFYVAYNWQTFAAGPMEILRIDHGGLVYHGGFLGACIAIVAACKVKSMHVWKAGDLLVAGLPLGHAVGRIGCFLNGCCFGWPHTGGCGVEYSPESGVLQAQQAARLLEPHLHEALAVYPIQLVASAMNLSVFLMLLLIEPRLERHGQLVATYLVIYGAGRFFVEFGRGDYSSRMGPFSPAQVVCLVMMPVGIILLAMLRKYGDAKRGTMAEVIS